jgi:hypothetical protein
VLSAVRAPDPIAAIRRMPGPEPLRRLVRAAGARGVPEATLALAYESIDRFDRVIRNRAGDRSSLDAILSAWVPESRGEFELRRKQSAFRAMSQLKGVATRALMATVVLAPSADGQHVDVTWVNALIGLHRVRPGAIAKLATRRMHGGDQARLPRTLEGVPIQAGAAPLLAEFCTQPVPALDVRTAGEVVHYALGGERFGAASAVDLVFAESNIGELARYFSATQRRKAFFFAEVQTPAEILQFDLLLHQDLYPGQEPALRVYDTVCEGVASANDPTRDIDRLHLLERVEPLPDGLTGIRSGDIPRYDELVRHVVDRLGRRPEAFRGYRCRVTYPVYGSQVMMVFDAVDAPGEGRGDSTPGISLGHAGV